MAALCYRWLANFRLPPGLSPGWHPVRLRFADSDFGTALRIAVDMPVTVEQLELVAVCDGRTWKVGEVDAATGGRVSCWVAGLAENADRANVAVLVDGRKTVVDFVGDLDGKGLRQVNAALPAAVGKGPRRCQVECGGVKTGELTVEVV